MRISITFIGNAKKPIHFQNDLCIWHSSIKIYNTIIGHKLVMTNPFSTLGQIKN